MRPPNLLVFLPDHNLKGDPIEAHNLYYTGKYDEVIARGRDEIHRWQEMTEDRLKI